MRALPCANASSALATIGATLLAVAFAAPARAEDPLRAQASDALARATAFFRGRVGHQGSYVWRVSDDLARREGEGRVGATTGWTQPPGTPSVGDAFLGAWLATRDPRYLDAAHETALALVRCQLRSGGWDYRLELDPAERRRHSYRVDPVGDAARDRVRNATTLDDDTTQSALRFLMRVDSAFRAIHRVEKPIAGAVEYALAALLAAQYPNGAWPQRFDRPAAARDPRALRVLRASYPETWSRTWTKPDYHEFFTLNDDVLADMVDTLLLAESIYDREDCLAAAKRAGEFLIRAQMPEPQPGWAQQYDLDLHPAWARKFEPPAITGGESRSAVNTLLRLARETGDVRFLAPIRPALDYYRRSLLPDGRLARFYELRTNRPLWFTRQYELTGDDGDLPTHYSFRAGNWLDAAERGLRIAAAPAPIDEPATPSPKRAPSRAVVDAARAASAALDERGAWVEDGRLRSFGDDDATRRVIDSRTFVRRVAALSEYLAATHQDP